MRSAARLVRGSKLSAVSYQLSVPQLSGSSLRRVDLNRLRKNPCSPQDREGHNVQSCSKSSNIKVGLKPNNVFGALTARIEAAPFQGKIISRVFQQTVEAGELRVVLAACLKACPGTNLAALRQLPRSI